MWVSFQSVQHCDIHSYPQFQLPHTYIFPPIPNLSSELIRIYVQPSELLFQLH